MQEGEQHRSWGREGYWVLLFKQVLRPCPRGVIPKERRGWICILWVPMRKVQIRTACHCGWQMTCHRFRLEVSKTLTVRVSTCWNMFPEVEVGFLVCSIFVWNLIQVRLCYSGLWALHFRARAFHSPRSVWDTLRCQLWWLLWALQTPVHQSGNGLKPAASFSQSTTRLSVTSNFAAALDLHQRFDLVNLWIPLPVACGCGVLWH